VAKRGRSPRPGREALTEAERRWVVEEFHGGGSRTEIVNRILERLERAGTPVSRRSVQRWVVVLDHITRRRWRDPLTDEQWAELSQQLGHLSWLTRRSVDGWILTNSAWKEEQARGDTLGLLAQQALLAQGGGKPALALLLLTMSLRSLLQDILHFLAFPREERLARQDALQRHLETLAAGDGSRPGQPARRTSADPLVELQRLALALLGPLHRSFLRRMLEAEAFLRGRGIELLPPDADGNPRWLDAAQVHYGFPRWAAFVASCRLLELAVREELPPDWRWLELANQTLQVEVEWGLLRMNVWLGSRLTTEQALELRRWVWQQADGIRAGEVALPGLSDVRGHVRDLAEAWKAWWAADGNR